MNFVNDKDLNLTMGAGEGNENTVSMRVMKSIHPQYESDPVFFSAPFEFEPAEKAHIKALIDRALSQQNMPVTQEQLNIIMNAIPKIWLTQMHAWSPTIMSINHPDLMGNKKIDLTGFEIIQNERHEQIHKHKRTVEYDREHNQTGELIEAAQYIMNLLNDGPRLENASWPENWDVEPWLTKIKAKDEIGKLAVAGALYWAECQRIDQPGKVFNADAKLHQHRQSIAAIAKRINRILISKP